MTGPAPPRLAAAKCIELLPDAADTETSQRREWKASDVMPEADDKNRNVLKSSKVIIALESDIPDDHMSYITILYIHTYIYISILFSRFICH